MAKSPRALVEPSLLVWARKSARVTSEDAAARLKIPEARLLDWEAGEAGPSIAQLRSLAEFYRRPVAVFFLSEPPRDFEPLRDFRRTEPGKVPLSSELEGDLRRAGELRESALFLLDPAEAEAPFPVSVNLDEDSTAAAGRIRNVLGVTHDEQLAWRDSHQALREWRLAVERIGTLVINMKSVSTADARGFSISEYPLPLIALNTKDAANGRLFTLMHEVVHLALHEGGICDWTPERKLLGAARRIEAFCNRVGAAVLLPENLVYEVLAGVEIPEPSEWTDEVLKRSSRKLCVSEEAFLRRLTDMGLASESLYAKKRSEYLALYAAKASRASKPVVSYEKRVVGQLGTAYLDLAFSAYYTKRLTLSELSSYTGVRVNNLGRVEQEAFGLSRVPGTSS